MKKALDKLSLWATIVASVTISAMAIIMTVDAIARKFVGTLLGAYETTVGLMVIVMFWTQGYAQMNKTHVTVDILTMHMSSKRRAILEGVGGLLGAGAFGLLTWLSLAEALESTRVGEIWFGLINYPVWPFRWAVVPGMLLLSAQFLHTGIDGFRKSTRKKVEE